jgi:hypothetical protein
MPIREHHPDSDAPDGMRDLPVTHVYEHPDGHGLGEHHADPGDDPLHERPAIPGQVLEQMLPEFRVSMADLDLPRGAELAHVATDEDSGNLIFAWTDKQGNPRRTSFTPEQAGQFLTAQGAAETEGKAS